MRKLVPVSAPMPLEDHGEPSLDVRCRELFQAGGYILLLMGRSDCSVAITSLVPKGSRSDLSSEPSRRPSLTSSSSWSCTPSYDCNHCAISAIFRSWIQSLTSPGSISPALCLPLANLGGYLLNGNCYWPSTPQPAKYRLQIRPAGSRRARTSQHAHRIRVQIPQDPSECPDTRQTNAFAFLLRGQSLQLSDALLSTLRSVSLPY